MCSNLAEVRKLNIFLSGVSYGRYASATFTLVAAIDELVVLLDSATIFHVLPWFTHSSFRLIFDFFAIGFFFNFL